MKEHKFLKVALWIVPLIILLLAIIFPAKSWVYVVNLVLSLIELALIIFNVNDKHNSSKVVLATILCFLILSWVIPAAYYSSQYVEQGRVQMGLFDLVNYPFTSLSYFGYIALFLILVGGFYGVLNKIPAYHNYLERMVSKFNGKEYLVLAIISIVLAFGVSICGLQIGFALFIPLIVSLIFLMGYDKIVAALVVVGSMTVGFAGSTFATSNVNTLITALSLSTDYQIGVRFVILVVGIVLVLLNTIMYIKKHKKAEVSTKDEKVKEEVIEVKDVVKEETTSTKKASTSTKKTTKGAKSSTKSSKSTSKKSTKKTTKKNANKAAVIAEDVIAVNTNTNKANVWPFHVFFGLLFILMILAFIPWSDAFGISAFTDATSSITEFKIFGFDLFAKLLGTVNAFGSWTVVDLLLPMLLVIVLLAIIYRVKLDDVFDGFVEGAKKALLPAVIVLLLYTTLVLVTYHPYQLTVYKEIIGSKFNVVTTSIVAILSSLFNFEASYVYQSVLPYYTSVITNSANYPLVGVIFQSMYGLTMLFAPTSLILMGVLSYLGVSYKQWLKNVWKLLLEFFIILLIIFIILALI